MFEGSIEAASPLAAQGMGVGPQVQGNIRFLRAVYEGCLETSGTAWNVISARFCSATMQELPPLLTRLHDTATYACYIHSEVPQQVQA